MPRTVTTEAIDPARRRLLTKLSDKHAQRPPMADQPVKYQALTARGSREKEDQFEYMAGAQDLTRRRLPEEALARHDRNLRTWQGHEPRSFDGVDRS